MHLTEVAPVTQIRPLRPVAAAVQTSWHCELNGDGSREHVQVRAYLDMLA